MNKTCVALLIFINCLMVSLCASDEKPALAQELIPEFAHQRYLQYQDKWKKLLGGDIFSWTQAKDLGEANRQDFKFTLLGLHPKRCRQALPLLTRYEQYQDKMTFITHSTYQDATASFLMEHALLPFKMGLKVKIPRLEGVGVYPFSFEGGFLPNLNGKIHISEKDQRCLFFLWGQWQRPKSPFNNTVLELFSQTLLMLGMEKLFRW